MSKRKPDAVGNEVIIKKQAAWLRGLEFCDYLMTVQDSFYFRAIITEECRTAFENGATTETFCGTVGCAVGHIPFWDKGKKDGWRVSKKRGVFDVFSPSGELAFVEHVADYFGISVYQAQKTFYGVDGVYSDIFVRGIRASDVAASLHKAIRSEITKHNEVTQ